MMNNPMSLEHKTIIITGAASGIGRESARLLHSLGAKLLLLDVNEDGLNSIQKQLGNNISIGKKPALTT